VIAARVADRETSDDQRAAPSRPVAGPCKMSPTRQHVGDTGQRLRVGAGQVVVSLLFRRFRSASLAMGIMEMAAMTTSMMSSMVSMLLLTHGI